MKGLADFLKVEHDKEDQREDGASYETRSNFLRFLNEPGKNMYAGTVPVAEVQKRRAKGKRQKASRTRNRIKK
jgi:hypothetical protein